MEIIYNSIHLISVTFYKTFAVVTEFWLFKSVIFKLVLSSFPYFLSFSTMNALSFVHCACHTVIITDCLILKIVLGNLKSVKNISCKKFSL